MLTIKSGNPLKRKVEMLVIPVCENKDIFKDETINSMIADVKKLKEFSGKDSEEILLYDLKGVSAKRVIFAGIGKAGSVNDELLRGFAGRIVKKAIGKKINKIAFAIPDLTLLKMAFSPLVKSLMEGACLANYIFDKYLSEKVLRPLEGIEFLTDANNAGVGEDLARTVENTCRGTLLTRGWVSDPSDVKTPEKYVKTLEAAFSSTVVEFTVLDKNELEKIGCGAILAVAKGSMSPPFLAVADYKPDNYKKTVVLVGKGVTFDAGGLDIKTAAGMISMKCDMAGAATVAGTMVAIAALKPEIRVIGVMPIVENMPSGDAYRPGDILTTYSGKTVEIGNTDAEGRLILADALAYAEKIFKPDVIIDLATLTGACVMALGEKIAGVFSFSDRLAAKITASGNNTGERCWTMPMPLDYKKLLKSEFADMNNMASTRYGGAITAALFLSEFVKTRQWVHIDIAGPAYLMKASDYSTPGGTGFGVRLLCDYLTGL